MIVTVANESIMLRADRSLFWPARRTLFLADVHFGKPESFRRFGIPAVGDPTTDALTRIEQALSETKADRLVILGDFWHAKGGKTPDVLFAIADWRRRHPTLEIDLAQGNHDRSAGGIPADWGFTVHTGPVALGPFVISHYPDPHPAGFVLSGHLHPSIRIHGKGRQSLRLPCFWFTPAFGVLPAFGGYTGTADIRPEAGDTVVAIADDELIAIT